MAGGAADYTQYDQATDVAAWTGMPDVLDTSQPGALSFPGATAPPSTDGQWVQTAISTGLQVYNTSQAVALQKQQIAAGQTPSVGYDPRTGAPTGQPVGAGMALGSSSGLFTILIIGAGIWMVAKK